MTSEEVWKIVENSEREDWLENDAGDCVTEIVYKNDVNVRFIDDLGCNEQDNFNEEWATKHPDSHAKKHDLQLFYANSLIANIPVVAVDGGRARIPYPDMSTNEIPFREYKAAKIGSQGNDRIDEYIERSHLTVAKP